MGEIACNLADYVVVTDDNPRSENPDSIRRSIIAGQDGEIHDIADRRDAMAHAVQAMRVGDVLVVAGKGHEQGQIYGDQTVAFDDVTELQKILSNQS